MIQYIQSLLKSGCLIKHPLWSLLCLPVHKLLCSPHRVSQKKIWWHIPLSHSLYSSPQAGNIVCQGPLRKSRSLPKSAVHFMNPQNLKCNVQYSCVCISHFIFLLFYFILISVGCCIWCVCDLRLLCVMNTMSICLTSVMCFYMPQVAKGKAPHVRVINFSKVYWRNHVIKWVSYFHSTYLPTTAAWQSWVSKYLCLVFNVTTTIAIWHPKCLL